MMMVRCANQPARRSHCPPGARRFLQDNPWKPQSNSGAYLPSRAGTPVQAVDRRGTQLSRPRVRAALQPRILARHRLADHHSRVLDWYRRRAGLAVPPDLGLHRLPTGAAAGNGRYPAAVAVVAHGLSAATGDGLARSPVTGPPGQRLASLLMARCGACASGGGPRERSATGRARGNTERSAGRRAFLRAQS